MRRRELLSFFFGGLVGGFPAAAQGHASARGALRREPDAQSERSEQLSLRVQELLSDIEVLQRERMEAEQYRTEILTLVHTMRQPLSCIHIAGDMMCDHARLDVSDKLRRELEIAVRSCQRLAEVVNDVFAADRSWRQAAIEAGEREVARARVSGETF
jgi:signal transduction histidine kinase